MCVCGTARTWHAPLEPEPTAERRRQDLRPSHGTPKLTTPSTTRAADLRIVPAASLLTAHTRATLPPAHEPGDAHTRRHTQLCCRISPIAQHSTAYLY